MSKATELTVDVTARLCISDETADRCLRLLEMWLEDHPGMTIVAEEKPILNSAKNLVSLKRWKMGETKNENA